MGQSPSTAPAAPPAAKTDAGTGPVPTGHAVREQALALLLAHGFDAGRANQALITACRELADDGSVDQVVRHALAYLCAW